MGVISIRFNANEEKILNKLTRYYHEDKSKLLKKSIFDLYENLIDKNEIAKFEHKENLGKVQFLTADQILSEIK
jgi:uncharacterized membrane protein YgaE (UPF0421/DUF939 family)